jgi:hypothetical protein
MHASDDPSSVSRRVVEDAQSLEIDRFQRFAPDDHVASSRVRAAAH